MALDVNQFAQSTVQGQLDLERQNESMSFQVASSQATPLVAGQPVKFVDSATVLPQCVAMAANTDFIFGFVVRSLKDANFPANSRVEIAFGSAVMYMTAGGAITRGGKVEAVAASSKVIASAGTNPVCGVALDKAAADGDLIRVLLKTPN